MHQQKNQRRGQMQIGEMIMVLFVVMVLAMLAIAWTIRSGGSETNRAFDEDARIALAQTAKGVADIPELRFSLAGREDTLIIDWRRALAFEENIDDLGAAVYRERYAGYSAVLDCITPCEGRIFQAITLFDYTDAEAALRRSDPFVLPVLLYDPVSKNSSFGSLTVRQVIQ